MLVNKSKSLLAASAILACVSFSVSAHDDGDRFYAENPYNSIWKTSYGACWNAGSAKGPHLPECGGEKKAEPVKVAHDHSHNHGHSHFGGEPHTHEHKHMHQHTGGDMTHGSDMPHAHGSANGVHMHGHKMATRAISPEPKAPKSITISAASLFDFDSSELTDNAKSVIDAELQKVDAGSKLTSNVRIVGHTDSMGPEAYNQGLSERRAKSVASHLETNPKISDANIETSGMGETAPIADNNTIDGRAKNRRVEIFFGK